MRAATILINMERNPERLEFMTEQFKRLGMDFELLIATDGTAHDFENEYDEELFKKNNEGRTMSKGEQGCAQSHKRALEKMLGEDLDIALIMEDDVEISHDFKEILDQELIKREQGTTSWEYLSFNYPSVGWKSIVLWLYLFFNMMKENREKISYWLNLPLYFIKFLAIVVISLFEGIREVIYKRMYTYGKPIVVWKPLYLAGCYLVTRSGAKKLVELNQKLSHTADGLPNTARVKKGLRFHAFVPRVARQKRETFESTLNTKLRSKKINSY